jgi:hypothetical protein
VVTNPEQERSGCNLAYSDLACWQMRNPHPVRNPMQTRSITALAAKFLVLVLVLAGAAWAADSNVGTWKLNTAKSTYSPGPAPKSNAVTIVAVDNGILPNENAI